MARDWPICEVPAAEELEVVRGALASAQEMILLAEDEALRTRAELERLRAAAGVGNRSEAATPEVTRLPTPARTGRLLAVLDVDPGWELLAGPERRVVVLRPGADLPAALGALAPDGVLVNLAAPGAFDAMIALRASRCSVPFSACLASAEGADALGLGRVEVTDSPLDPDLVLGRLGAVHGKRVLTAGADADRFIALRKHLARAGMSVSMAWDAKQAAALLDMMKPDVAIIDLALPPRGGHGLVASLSAIDPPPFTMLVPGGGDADERFTAALADPWRPGRRVAKDHLLTGLLQARKPIPGPDVFVPRK